MNKNRVFIIGPGGVGKTTVGKFLAQKLNYQFIDLDEQFMTRVGHIGEFIRNESYEKYCYRNSDLFMELLDEYSENVLIPLSSGFLVHKGLDFLTNKHKELISKEGLTIRLLPSDSLKESMEIVVKRQLKRGFGLREDREREKFLYRYPIYNKLGDIQIYSYEKPELIAQEIFEKIKIFNEER